MSKLVLYVFEGGELEEVITNLNKIKKRIEEYENNTKGSSKKMEKDSRKK